MKKFILATLGVALVGASLNANALGVAQAVVTPTLTITSGCVVDTNSLNVDFGLLAVGSAAAVVSAGDISVSCAPGVVYKVGIDAGLHVVGATRNLNLGVNNVPYNFTVGNTPLGDVGLNVLDASYTETTAVLGGALAAGPFTGNSLPQLVAVTATVTPGAAPAGIYTDTVVVTVAW
jgi:spore coat protein U-like protein